MRCIALFNVPTRVRLLARLDKTQAALELAEGSLEPMRRVVDRHIFEITQLLTAENVPDLPDGSSELLTS